MSWLDLRMSLPWLIAAAILAVLVALLWRRRGRRHAARTAAPPPTPARAPGPVPARAPAETAPSGTGELMPRAAPALSPKPPSEPIIVAGRTISPAQYRSLFRDLRAMPEAGPHLVRHFLNHGRHEIAGGKRLVAPDRLLAIELQQLSPLAPQAAPSANWRFIPGEADTLDIICSHTAPEGEFAPTVQATAGPGARLFLKYRHHDFYQGGIPGLAGTIDETARWIEAVIARTKPHRIRTIGFSAGGYAAILFGHLLSADAIYACGAELALGAPQYPSARWYPEGVYDPAYRELRPFLPRLRGRIALFYAAYDPIAFRAIQAVREAGLDNLGLVADFHPCVTAVPLEPLLQTAGPVLPVSRTGSLLHPAAYDDIAVERIATAYEAFADGDLARSEPLLERALADDALNFGFMCHLGVHRALRGDPEGAERMIRAGLAGIMQLGSPAATGIARHALALPRSSYRPSREQLRAIEMMFDRIFRELAAPAVQQRGSAA